MKVHVERDFLRNNFRVWFVERTGSQSLITRYKGDGVWERVPWDERTETEPSLVLPEEMLEELIRAAEGHVHVQDATVRHLDDATGTRDRLLALIEKRGLR